MLNKDNERELAYIVKIDAIEPIVGSDNCEAAIIGGWRVMTRKNTFKTGDYAVYFEIDSKVPETEPFKFLEKKHYKVKTQKYTFGGKGNFISQGLLMSLEDFKDEWGRVPVWLAEFNLMVTNANITKAAGGEEEVEIPYFLTKKLGVKYSVAEDNSRKSKTDKFTKMKARHQKLFRKNKIVQWLWERQWGKEVLFFFLGCKKDKRGWPDWVRKTDEERCQNLPQLFPDDGTKWIVTEKIDGSSTTFTYRRKGKSKGFFVCSRNVCFDTPAKADKCYYDTNIYLEMAEKYNIEEKLKDILEQYGEKYDFVTLQGETYGEGVQKRTYGLQGHDFMAFNLIFGNDINNQYRVNSEKMRIILLGYEIPSVPILDTDYQLPQTCDDLLAFADGESQIDGKTREGIVLRTQDGESSFKAVSNKFLLEYKE